MCTLDNHMSSLLAKLAADVEVVDDNARLPGPPSSCGHRRNRPSWKADMHVCSPAEESPTTTRQELRWKSMETSSSSSSGSNPVPPRRSRGDTTMTIPKRTMEGRMRGRKTSSLPPSLRTLPYDVPSGSPMEDEEDELFESSRWN